MALDLNDTHIFVLVNETSVDLTFYFWYNPTFFWEDNYSVSYQTIHPGDSYLIYLDEDNAEGFGQRVVQQCKDKNGNWEYKEGQRLTKFLIARCSDVGAFFDVPSTADTCTVEVKMDTAYSRTIIKTIGGKLKAFPYVRDELPEHQEPTFDNPSMDWDTDDDSGMTERPDMGEQTQGNPSDDGNIIDHFLRWMEKYGPLLLVGGGLFFVLLIVLILRR